MPTFNCTVRCELSVVVPQASMSARFPPSVIPDSWGSSSILGLVWLCSRHGNVVACSGSGAPVTSGICTVPHVVSLLSVGADCTEKFRRKIIHFVNMDLSIQHEKQFHQFFIRVYSRVERCYINKHKINARRQVVNNDPSAAVHYKLTVAPSFTDITLAPNEQTLINNIWTQCA